MPSTVFTTTGANTFNWPTGVTTCIAEGLGAGGCGGAALGNPSSGGGGKGGGYAKKTITKGAESSMTITVGAGLANSNGGDSGVQQGASVVMLAPGGAQASSAGSNSINSAGQTSHPSTAIGDTTFAGGNGGTGNFTSGVQGSGAGGGAAGSTSVGGNGNVNVAGSAGTGAFANGVVYSGAGAAGVGNSLAGAVGPSAGPVYGGAGSGGKANNNTDRLGGAGRQGVVVITYPGGNTIVEVSSYRFFEDDSSTETSLTPLGTESAAYSLDLTSEVDKDCHLRIGLLEGSGISVPSGNGDNYILQYSKNGGSWAAIASGQPVESRLSSNYTEGQSMNADLVFEFGSTGQFPGKFSEDGKIEAMYVEASPSISTECMYSIKVKASLLAHGDYIEFRLLREKEGFSGSTQVHGGLLPRLNIVKTSGGMVCATWEDTGNANTVGCDFYNSNGGVSAYGNTVEVINPNNGPCGFEFAGNATSGLGSIRTGLRLNSNLPDTDSVIANWYAVMDGHNLYINGSFYDTIPGFHATNSRVRVGFNASGQLTVWHNDVIWFEDTTNAFPPSSADYALYCFIFNDYQPTSIGINDVEIIVPSGAVQNSNFFAFF
jgi:hypothetical protein